MSTREAPNGPCIDGPCTEATEHVWDYLDGEMSAGDCARIKAHIEDCPPCADLFNTEKKVKDVVARACGCEEVPQDLRSRIGSMVKQMRSEMCGKARAADSQ